MIGSYPSIYALGHRYILDLFDGEVVIEEKIDGSQFSVSVTEAGELVCRSKGQQIVVDAPEKMFALGVATAVSLKDKLIPGYVYRGEYLNKPKHNTLTYGRVPAGNWILFDVMTGPEVYLTPEQKYYEARRLGLEVVPAFFNGGCSNGFMPPGIEDLLNRESILGGCKIEGIVAKNYGKMTPDKKIMIGKFVSPDFKEKHQHAWKKSNPTQTDVVQHIIGELRTEARWRKAIQHLREAGKITDTPADIGPVLKEIQADVLREEGATIADALKVHFWPQIARGIVGGFPEFYKRACGILTTGDLAATPADLTAPAPPAIVSPT